MRKWCLKGGDTKYNFLLLRWAPLTRIFFGLQNSHSSKALYGGPEPTPATAVSCNGVGSLLSQLSPKKMRVSGALDEE